MALIDKKKLLWSVKREALIQAIERLSATDKDVLIEQVKVEREKHRWTSLRDVSIASTIKFCSDNIQSLIENKIKQDIYTKHEFDTFVRFTLIKALIRIGRDKALWREKRINIVDEINAMSKEEKSELLVAIDKERLNHKFTSIRFNFICEAIDLCPPEIQDEIEAALIKTLKKFGFNVFQRITLIKALSRCPDSIIDKIYE